MYIEYFKYPLNIITIVFKIIRVFTLYLFLILYYAKENISKLFSIYAIKITSNHLIIIIFH